MAAVSVRGKMIGQPQWVPAVQGRRGIGYYLATVVARTPVKPNPRAKPAKRWTWDRDNDNLLGPDRIDFDGKLFCRLEQTDDRDLAHTRNVIAMVRALNDSGVVLPKARRR